MQTIRTTMIYNDIEAFLSRTCYLHDTFALACGFKVNYETLLGVLGIRDNRTNNLGIKDKRATKFNE